MPVEYTTRAGLRVDPLGTSWVVYCPASGDTHLLNDAAAAVIELVGETPGGGLESLTERLALDTEVEPASLLPVVEETLSNLREMGLVVAL